MTVAGIHPQRLDLYVHPGDPISQTLSVYDSSGVVVASLAGYTCAAVATDQGGQVLHTFTAAIVSNQVQISATAAQTGAWAWPVYAGRLVVTATPSGGSPSEVATGWVRLYRP